MSQRVSIEIQQKIAWLRLDRPEKHNAVDVAMFRAIASAQYRLARERTLRAVILHGAGADFCSGLDVSALRGNRRGACRLLWKWLPWRANHAQKVGVGWRRLSVPVIASIQGRCWGAGLQIALGADFRLARPDASLSVMEGRWGLIPDMGGTLALRELMRLDQAMHLAMTATEIDGDKAQELGLVTALDTDPLQASLSLAEELSKRSPDAIGAVKRLYRKSWSSRRGLVLARETAYQLRVLAGTNQRIAVRRQMGEDREYRRPARW